MSDLKPCPFCGGEADVTLCQSAYGQSYRIHHEHASPCPAAYVNGLQFRTEAEAIAAWNSRAERTCRNICKEWAKTSFTGAETSFCCSECGAHYVDCESYYAGLADADGEQIRTNYCPNCGAKVVDE